MSAVTIGRAAHETGCKVQTIRYYEQIGLMPAPDRTGGNQRLYDRADIGRLAFVRHARELGFSIGMIRELLAVSDQPDRPCDEVDALARRHLAAVEARIERMQALRDELRRMIAQCGGGSVSDCRIIEALADHASCRGLHDRSERTVVQPDGRGAMQDDEFA